MRVCIDTNVLVQMFGRLHPHGVIRRALLDGRFELAVSTGILLEYEEIVTRMAGAVSWWRVERQLAIAFELHSNILFFDPTFHFQVIAADADDDKFADCAIAAQADFIVTSDQHFNALIGSGYKPQPITPEEFTRRYC
jgi:putative PIN family toxin of toxin-antitoxin system